MAKEIPYFKFQPSEWVTGDITLCSMEAQGLFINLCCYYWMKDCNISLSNAQQRFSNCFSLFEELQKHQIFKVNPHEGIVIEFLDEQMQKFTDISAKRSKSGSMKVKANDKQMISKSKSNAHIYREDKEINILFSFFWDAYDKKEGDKKACEKKWNKLTDADRQKIIDTLPTFKSKIKDKQYQPYPATYLNQRRWDNLQSEPVSTIKNQTQTFIDNDWERKKLEKLGLR